MKDSLQGCILIRTLLWWGGLAGVYILIGPDLFYVAPTHSACLFQELDGRQSGFKLEKVGQVGKRFVLRVLL